MVGSQAGTVDPFVFWHAPRAPLTSECPGCLEPPRSKDLSEDRKNLGVLPRLRESRFHGCDTFV